MNEDYYNYGITDFDEVIDNKYILKQGKTLQQKYNLSNEDVVGYLNNNAWFAYLLLIPNNGISYTNYFKIAFSCYVEALKIKNVIKNMSY